MFRALIRNCAATALVFGVSVCPAIASVVPGYLLEVTLRIPQESPGRPYVVRLPLDAAAARDLQSDPATQIRPHILTARQTYARNRGYEGPAFRFGSHEIVPITGWRWRLLKPGSETPVVQGSSRWR